MGLRPARGRLGGGLALEPEPGRARAAGRRRALRRRPWSVRAGPYEGPRWPPSAMLPADAPAWRRHFHGDGYGYGWLLRPDPAARSASRWPRPRPTRRGCLTIFLQGFTLIAALAVSGRAPLADPPGGRGHRDRRGQRRRDPDRLGRPRRSAADAMLGFLLVALAPAAILVGVVRQARRAGMITVRTMFGVLCVYLLIGSAFALRVRDHLRSSRTAASSPRSVGGDLADFLYFSFTTMTTTGFGDLTAAHDLGRSLAITRGADRPDLPGHARRADRRQPRPRARRRAERPGARRRAAQAGAPPAARRRRRLRSRRSAPARSSAPDDADDPTPGSRALGPPTAETVARAARLPGRDRLRAAPARRADADRPHGGDARPRACGGWCERVRSAA